MCDFLEKSVYTGMKKYSSRFELISMFLLINPDFLSTKEDTCEELHCENPPPVTLPAKTAISSFLQ
jgi:hypothetical protein